ncbi:MAG: hypothetical protein ACFFBH_04350 [Promethearchaeota archaeon]
MGIGTYNDNEDFSDNLGVGSGGVNVNFIVSLTGYDKYRGTVIFNVISSGSVEKIGITDINYNIYKGTQTIATYDNNYIIPKLSYQKDHNLNLAKNDEVICQGNVIIKFLVGGIEQQVAKSFELAIRITISSAEIDYTWDVTEIWLQVFDYIAIAALVLFLIKVISSIKFEKQYTPEMKKEDEEFFEKIKESLERERTS